MNKFDKLIAAGIDTDALLKRLMGNTSLVRVFVSKFTEDKTFLALEDAFGKKDMKAAEMASHTLKGVCGNLSLALLYKLFSEQVDLIRKNEHAKAFEMMGEIHPVYESAIMNMREWLEET